MRCFLIIVIIHFSTLLKAQTTFEKAYLITGMKQSGVSVLEENGIYFTNSVSDDCASCITGECFTKFDQSGNVITNRCFSMNTTDESAGELTRYMGGMIFPVVYDYFTTTAIVKQVAIIHIDFFGNLVRRIILPDTLQDVNCFKLGVDSNNIIYAFVNYTSANSIIYFRIDSAGNILSKQNFGNSPVYSEISDFIYRDGIFYLLGHGNINGVPKTFLNQLDLGGNHLNIGMYDNPSVIRGSKLLFFDSGFLIAGQTFDVRGNAQVNLMHVDATGNVIYNRQQTISDKNYVSSIASIDNGNFVLTGKTIDSLNNVILFIIKSDSTGNPVWKRDFCLQGTTGCYASSGNSIITSDNNSIVVFGQIQYSQGNPEMYLLKTNQNGIVTAVNEIDDNAFRPALKQDLNSGKFFLENAGSNFTVELYNLQGKLLYAEKNKNEFELSLNPGIYLYSIRPGRGVFNGKLVVE